MVRCLRHKYVSWIYKWSFGVIRFLRNYKAHHNKKISVSSTKYSFEDQVLLEILELFPDLPGFTYLENFINLIDNELVVNSQSKDYQNLTYGSFFWWRPLILSWINHDIWNWLIILETISLEEFLQEYIWIMFYI